MRAEERPGADLRQHAPDVVLEDDHDQDQDHVADRVEHPIDGVELEELRALVGAASTIKPISIETARVPWISSVRR